MNRMLWIGVLAGCAAGAGLANPNRDGKTMAVDDWHAMAIYGVGGADGGPVYLQVHAGDLDGDGLPDDAVVRLACAGTAVQAAHYTIVSPRDAATGQASGKRTHKPVTFVKEWGAATPQLMAAKPTYNIKELKSARVVADGWQMLSLRNANDLCPAAQAAAAAVINTSRSNIKQ